MKRMTGTVTLSLVEEDNRQRVLFRLIPLCTREGVTFDNAKEAFLDEGSLRIVPDKHEQSTFKDRMRSLSGYCAVAVPSDGREQMKIRQNRNYAPQNGECNQYALYSDVVFEFAPGACYEVIPFGQSAAEALTKQVLLQKNKMLYGPVTKDQAGQIPVDQMPLFGNEAFLLHTFQTEAIGKRTVCWNPEAIMNWRQRRAEQRRADRENEAAKTDGQTATGEHTSKPAESAHPEKAPSASENNSTQKTERPQREKKAQQSTESKTTIHKETDDIPNMNNTSESAQETAKTAPIPKNNAEADAELLIGEKLTILDSSVSFEQQLSQLTQPISEHANLLSNAASNVGKYEEVDEEPEEIAHFSGTPLTIAADKTPSAALSRNNVPAAVDKQLRQQRTANKEKAANKGLYSAVENPIETLSDTLDTISQNTEMRSAAIRVLSNHASICTELLKVIQENGLMQETEAAAMEQLNAIEAERLALLIQFKQAQENDRKYREEAIFNAGQKKRAQISELNHRISVAEKTEKKLLAINQSLSQDIQTKLNDVMLNNAAAIGSTAGNTITISPIIGEACAFDEIIERIRVHMNASGYSITDDEAACLAITFALEDKFELQSANEADVELFATELVKCLGLYNCTAVCQKNDSLQLISLLKTEEGCTPTVSIQPVDKPVLQAYGHKTILVSSSCAKQTGSPATCPVILIARISKKQSVNDTIKYTPIAYNSFEALAKSSSELSPASDQWLKQFLLELQNDGIQIPESVEAKMRRFIAIGCNTMRGSFVSTADCAVAMWILPYLKDKTLSEQMVKQLTGFTRTLKLLQLQ